MSRIPALALGLVALLAAPGSARPTSAPDPAHGMDIHIYVADIDRKLVDPGDLEIVIHIDRSGGKRKTLETELSTPKGARRFGLGHGGQIVRLEGYFVEFVMFDPHKDLVDETDGSPYFRTDISVVEIPEFQATVAFKIKGKLQNAEGFEYPVVPETYKEALAKLENRLSKLKKPAAAGDAESVFTAQSLTGLLWDGIPDLATVESRKSVDKICKEAAALSKELDKAVRANDVTGAAQVLDRYQAAVNELRKHVK